MVDAAMNMLGFVLLFRRKTRKPKGRGRLALLWLLAFMSVMPASLWAQNRCLAVKTVEDLNFSTVHAGEQGGGVTLTPEGERILHGDMQVGMGRSNAARFVVFGCPYAPFKVTVRPSSVILSAAAAVPMPLHDWQCSLPTFQGSLDGAGKAEFTLGATVDVAAQSAAGVLMAQGLRLCVRTPCFSAETTFSAYITLRRLLMLKNDSPLDFGTWLSRGQAGRVILLPTGVCTSPDPLGPLKAGGIVRPAAFTLQTYHPMSYTLQLPRQEILTGPAGTLTLERFSSDLPTQGVLLTGKTTFHVGGTLLVPAQPKPGRYSGTFKVSLHYY